MLGFILGDIWILFKFCGTNQTTIQAFPLLIIQLCLRLSIFVSIEELD